MRWEPGFERIVMHIFQISSNDGVHSVIFFSNGDWLLNYFISVYDLKFLIFGEKLRRNWLGEWIVLGEI